MIGVYIAKQLRSYATPQGSTADMQSRYDDKAEYLTENAEKAQNAYGLWHNLQYTLHNLALFHAYFACS